MDSNKSKILAMEKALSTVEGIRGGFSIALDYFKNNFGKSRFHHVDKFITEILEIEPSFSKELLQQSILIEYSKRVDEFYDTAPILPHFMDAIARLDNDLYVASGSEQEQLKRVLVRKGLDRCFKGIYGSPKLKVEIVNAILSKQSDNSKVLFVGDSVADLETAIVCDIDFMGVLGCSNTPEALLSMSHKHGYSTIADWEECLSEGCI